MADEMEARCERPEATQTAHRWAALSEDERMVWILAGLSEKKKVAVLCREMGVSRKQYYKLAKRARRALREALSPQRRGRKSQIADPEKEALRKQVKSLRQKLVRTETLLAVAQKIARDHPLGQRVPGEKKVTGGRRMAGRRKG